MANKHLCSMPANRCGADSHVRSVPVSVADRRASAILGALNEISELRVPWSLGVTSALSNNLTEILHPTAKSRAQHACSVLKTRSILLYCWPQGLVLIDCSESCTLLTRPHSLQIIFFGPVVERLQNKHLARRRRRHIIMSGRGFVRTRGEHLSDVDTHL